MIMATTVLVVLGCVFAIALLGVARSRSGASADSHAAQHQFQRIHIPALLNLIDPTQDDFLRSRLPREEFIKLRRQKSRVLIVYVKRILTNCRIFLSVADRAIQSSDPEIASAGRTLLNAAFRTRLNALISLASLYCAVLMPKLPSNLEHTIGKYSRSQDQVSSLQSHRA